MSGSESGNDAELLLFVVGTLCGAGTMNLLLAIGLLSIAAVAGDQINYRIGQHFGPRVFRWEQSRFFNKRAFDRAHAFYERYGGVTIILALFGAWNARRAVGHGN